MPWNLTSWLVTSRARAPHERPREYNDPSKAHQLDQYYDQPYWPARLRTVVSLVVLVAILSFAGFIIFNVVAG